jgi:nucleotide-binding universal stress UspA family protein
MKFTLVVLTSFYPAAQQAVRYADALASTLGGQLVLLHVERAFHFEPYLFPGDARRRPNPTAEEETRAQLDRLVGGLRTASVAVELAPDILPEAVLDLARRHEPAIFVVGLPAPGTAEPDQISTAALQLLRGSRLPMLLVPLSTKAPVLPQRVLVAADSEGFALHPSAAGVTCLLGNRSVEVTVAHVSPMEDDRACTAALRAVERSGLLAGLPQADLRGYCRHRPAEGVLEATRDTQADLVVMLARTRSFLGALFHRSVTAQVISQSAVPVLVVPASEPLAERHERTHPPAKDQLLRPKT